MVRRAAETDAQAIIDYSKVVFASPYTPTSGDWG